MQALFVQVVVPDLREEEGQVMESAALTNLGQTLREAEQRDKLDRACAARQRRRIRQDEQVAGGVIKRQPVDKTAALLVSKAPWYAHDLTPKKDRGRDEMGLNQKVNIDKATVASESPKCPNGLVDLDALAAQVAGIIEDNMPPEIVALAARARSARSELHESIRSIGTTLEDFDRTTSSAQDRIRMRQMSLVAESKKVCNALRDVRQFFLGPDYEAERDRMAEFVGLCERLQALQESGFLDVVADTMLRLASDE